TQEASPLSFSTGPSPLPAALAPARRRPQMPKQEHVGIGPVSRLGFARPFVNVFKLVVEAFGIRAIVMPDIPDVVGDSPHLRVLPHLIQLFHWRGPGGKAEHNGSPGFVESLADHA